MTFDRNRLVALAFVFAAGCSPTVVGDPGSGKGRLQGDGQGGGGAGGSDTTSGSGDATGSGVSNAACSSPTPSPMPPLPKVNRDTSGRPLFDHWRDLACASNPETCSEGNDCGGACLRYQAGEGICDYGDADIWCDGEGEVIGYGNGTCWMCGPLQNHKDACCLGLPGFDCRAWPYPSDGLQGMVCARHEDCEPGLVCGASAGAGYGICQCPGTDSSTVVPPDACFDEGSNW